MTENENETPTRDAPPPTLQAADFGEPPPTARRRTPRRRAADAAKEAAAEVPLTTVDESTSTLAAVEIDTAAVVAPDPGEPPAPARAPRRRGTRTRRTTAAEAATGAITDAEATPEEVVAIDAAVAASTSRPAAAPTAATPAASPTSDLTNSWSTGRRYEIGPDGKVRYLDPGTSAAPATAGPSSAPPAPSRARPDRSDKFVWQPGDVTITPPAARPIASEIDASFAVEDEEIAATFTGESAVGSVEDPDLAPGVGDEGDGSDAVRRRRRSRRGGRGRSRNGSAAEGVLAEAESIAADAMDTEVAADDYAATAAPTPAPSSLVVPPSSPPPAARSGSPSPLEQLVARQNVILDQLMQRQQEMARSMERALTTIERRLTGTDLTRVSAMPRAGVFVDVPNIIYAADRYNIALDFGKLLDLVAQDRTLIRASAYAPISDDPTLRLEVQRFVQPFLGHGYRIVTKPLKRFNDGSIKANFDIELAMDMLTMSERMDIIILVSGDGDFHRLVELVQSKGVRVEVVAFAASTATELKAVADSYIDLTNHLRDLSVDR